ncbi:MAG: hypothetical protein IPK52_20030 [Chloroflexi bacterium]|nr:hypothetical protein [Chloroflexota bacterium]
MKRILVLVLALLTISAASFAQAGVPFNTALDTALADINSRLGTALTVNGGQVSYQYNEERVIGDNLGCPSVAATNQNSYLQMTTRFDLNFDGVFEWEHRFAYEADGTLRMVVCAAPSAQPTAAPVVVVPTATVSTDTTVTPQQTPSQAPVFGRDGPRVLPAMVCGSLETRLINGSTGRVVPGGAPNNLRQSPAVSAARLGELAPGSIFVVADGPFCVDDIAWFLVAAGAGQPPLGWTAEGRNGEYFLQPLLTDAQPISAGDAVNLRPYGAPFAAGSTAISANNPSGTLAASTDGAVSFWRTAGGFTTLDSVQWDSPVANPAQSGWLFVDNAGRLWVASVSASGEYTLGAPLEAAIAPFVAPGSIATPLTAVDNEGNFAAVVVSDPNAVSLVELHRDGTDHTVLITLAQPGAVRDVAFGPDGMTLYVLTDTQITVYPFVRGEGWTGQAQQVVTVDLVQGKLAVDESGSRVAVSGITAAGTAGLRIFNNLNTDAVGDETSVNFTSQDPLPYSRPSFSANGLLVAVYAANNAVNLLDAATGIVTFLQVSPSASTGAVAFTRDGLALLVLTSTGIQTYAIRQ